MANTTQNTQQVGASQNDAVEKVYHTVTACVRCRQRKTRCDPSLPRCEPCERSDSHCEYFDSTKNQIIPRTYITSLQATVKRLNEELRNLEKEEEAAYQPDYEKMIREGALVKFSGNDECRFLGPASGLTITRYIMEFAKQNYARRTIKEVVPQHTVEEIKQKFDAESAKPTSKVYPLISSVAAPDLPNRDLMERLVQIYMIKVQYETPLLHEPTFRETVRSVYDGSDDPTLNFQVRLVIAISMQKLDTQYAGLADSYYLAALSYLAEAVRKKDLSTLQCLILVAEYSRLTPTRTASYWVVGLAVKLCQELGLCDEETIANSPSGVPLNFLEVDMRRRVYWVVILLEYGLSHTMGRPSAFGVTVDNVNVKFFELCDDHFITPHGLEPGHHPVMQKCISVHICRMRLLQAEIRRTLYLRKRENPVTDQDPWFQEMLKKLDEWVRDCPKNDEGSGVSENWFQSRCNAIIISLYRPSPQIPTPSLDAARRCYDAATFNIRLQRIQAEARTVDVTWVFTAVVYSALNTVLWSISYPGIRQLHSREEVEGHTQDAMKAIEMCAERWPGVRSAHQLHENLIRGCLKAYDIDQLGDSPASDHLSPNVVQDHQTTTSQGAYSPTSTSTLSILGAQTPHSIHSNLAMINSPNQSIKGIGDGYENHLHAYSQANPISEIPQTQSEQYYAAAASQGDGSAGMRYDLPAFDQQVFIPYIPTTSQTMTHWNPLPTSNDPNMMPGSTEFDFTNPSWLPNFGEEYSQYMHQSYIPGDTEMQTLSEQQQIELMASLEQSQLPDLSRSMVDATAFYTPYLP